jgi:hypothetical protein
MENGGSPFAPGAEKAVQLLQDIALEEWSWCIQTELDTFTKRVRSLPCTDGIAGDPGTTAAPTFEEKASGTAAGAFFLLNHFFKTVADCEQGSRGLPFRSWRGFLGSFASSARCGFSTGESGKGRDRHD